VKSFVTGIFKTGLGWTYENQKTLDNISLSVEEGEFLGIVGRNGSGKSTLLKILAGIYQPTSGNVEVQGKLVPFIELGVGFNPELTGRENVYLNGALLGFSKREVEARYDDIVAFAELERFMDQKLKNYSSGMQVRLAFSVAIMAEADILLIDEVLAVGDADFQRKCFEYFRSLKKQKKTVVFVTHSMDAVREYCDRAVLLDQSRIILEGAPNTVAEGYMKLFAEERPASVEEKLGREEKRWGDGWVISKSVKLDKSLYTEADKEITFRVSLVAQKDLEEPIAGFLIKDSADHALFGTNTRIKQLRLGDLKAGDKCEVVWTVPNILADGKHFIDVTVEHRDGLTISDWWTEAASFNVKKLERTAYTITPNIEARVKQ